MMVRKWQELSRKSAWVADFVEPPAHTVSISLVEVRDKSFIPGAS